MKLIIHALLAFFILTTFASAGIVTAAIGLLGSVFSSTLLKGVLYVALSIGASLLQKALMRKPSLEVGGSNLEIQMGDDLPAGFPVGKCATGGKRKYTGVWGKEGNTHNAYLVDVIEFSSLPTSGNPSFWAGDQKLSVLTNEPHEDGRGFPVLEYRKDGKDYMWVKWYLGDQTTADPYLVDKFAVGERPWGNNFIGLGTSYAIFTCRYHDEVYTSGLPEWLIEPASIPLYDPRKDSTVGGNGSQRFSDPSTWEPSDNPMVIIYNIVRGIYYKDQWMYGGQNVGIHRWPLANAFAAMNACDQIVDNEKAYRAGCFVDVDINPLDLIDDLLQGCNGRMAENGGFFKAVVGAGGAQVMSFNDSSVIITKGQSYLPFPTLDETYNGIAATYPEPLERWSVKDAPSRYMPDLEALDGGRRLATEIEFPTVPFPNQIQRLMLSLIQDYRRFRIHQFWLPPQAYVLEPNDIVAYTSAKNGYVNKKFMVIDIEGHSSMCQLVTLREIDPSDYDWSPSDHLDTEFGWVGEITVPPQRIVGWTVVPTAVVDEDGDKRRPALQISCAPDIDGVTHIHVQVRAAHLNQLILDSDSIVYEEPYTWLIVAGINANQWYDVRARYVSSLNDNQQWTDWFRVQAENILLGPKDVYPVDVDEVIKEVGDSIHWLSESNRYVQEELDRIGAWASEQEAGNFTERQVLRNEIKLTNDNTTARFNEIIEIAVGPNSAIVTRIEDLEVRIENDIAQAVDLLQTKITDVDGRVTANATSITSLQTEVNNVASSVTLRGEAESSPGGGWARWGAQVKTGSGNTWSSAAFYIDTNGALSRFVVAADQFLVTDATGQSRQPLLFTNGELYVTNARLATLKFDQLESNNGKLIIRGYGNFSDIRMWT